MPNKKKTNGKTGRRQTHKLGLNTTPISTIWRHKLRTVDVKLSQATAMKQVNAQDYLNTKYGTVSFGATLAQFVSDGSIYAKDDIYGSYDVYRFREIEVWASVANMPLNGYSRRFNVWIAPDYDDTSLLPWEYLVQKGRCTRTVLNPVDGIDKHVATIQMCPDFDDASGNSPANMVLDGSQWFDMNIASQRFVGLKAHVEVNSGLTETFTPVVSFHMRAKIELRARR